MEAWDTSHEQELCPKVEEEGQYEGFGTQIVSKRFAQKIVMEGSGHML